MKEKWKTIDFNSDYEVSNTGKIRSKKYRKEKPLSQSESHGGHKRVVLYENGTHKAYFVHRLVAEAFVDNPNDYPIVRHLNGLPYDNRAENLSWGTQKDNVEDSIKMGTHVFKRREMSKEIMELGNAAHRTPICVTNTITGDTLIFNSQKEAARALGIHKTSFNQILKGSRKNNSKYKIDYFKEYHKK